MRCNYLFSGAPTRGHVPILLDLYSNSCSLPKKEEVKLDLTTMNWNLWNRDIESSLQRDLVDDLLIAENFLPEELLDLIDSCVKTSTERHCSTKRVCRHSKPYWTKELSMLSEDLRKKQSKYMLHNTDINFERFQLAKTDFEHARKTACQDFIKNKTHSLNVSQSAKFWKEFQCMFKPNCDTKVEALSLKDGTITTSNDEIECELFDTFFKGTHIEQNKANFDEDFHKSIKVRYDQIKGSNFIPDAKDLSYLKWSHHSSSLYSPILEDEVWDAITQSTQNMAKSFDNKGIHPQMIANLGPNTAYALTKLFNKCLYDGKWVWNLSKVVFLKKEGKTTYSKPGSYRPISISPYMGKLLERILSKRLENYMSLIDITDPNQEGFTKGRNSIRYLHRLTSGIKGDIRKRLTVLCLFLDFEKAFDSVWKCGLVVKLWDIGVHGPFLKIIDSFLFERQVMLLVNGYMGPIRDCLDFGLPQGAVQSPLLFRFFVYDLDEVSRLYQQITFFKFAADGSAKVACNTLDECLHYLNIVLESLHAWTSKWRMVINCEINKTEVICFHSHTPKDVPDTFHIGSKQIKLVTSSKVLGIIIDKKLSFKEHSTYVYNRLVYRWINLCRCCNRNWGMNHHVLIRIIKAVIFSTLLYGSLIWMNICNMEVINRLWCKMAKTSVGAIFNVSPSLLEVILGVPPLQVQNRVIAIKHYLKTVVHVSRNDYHLDFIGHEICNSNPEVLMIIRDVFKFLEWKLSTMDSGFSSLDRDIISTMDQQRFIQLSESSCSYNKVMMQKFTEFL